MWTKSKVNEKEILTLFELFEINYNYLKKTFARSLTDISL